MFLCLAGLRALGDLVTEALGSGATAWAARFRFLSQRFSDFSPKSCHIFTSSDLHHLTIPLAPHTHLFDVRDEVSRQHSPVKDANLTKIHIDWQPEKEDLTSQRCYSQWWFNKDVRLTQDMQILVIQFTKLGLTLQWSVPNQIRDLKVLKWGPCLAQWVRNQILNFKWLEAVSPSGWSSIPLVSILYPGDHYPKFQWISSD